MMKWDALWSVGGEAAATDKPVKRDTFMPPSHVNGQQSPAQSPSCKFFSLALLRFLSL